MSFCDSWTFLAKVRTEICVAQGFKGGLGSEPQVHEKEYQEIGFYVFG